MDVLRLWLVATDERVPFGQRAAPATRLCPRHHRSPPLDLRKSVAVIFSVLVLVAPKSFAAPTGSADDCVQDSRNWKEDFIRMITNPCAENMDLRNAQPHTHVNYTLIILRHVKSFSSVAQQFANDFISESRNDPSSNCDSLPFGELARWNRNLTSKENPDKKAALNELYRVLAIYTVHGLHVTELGKIVPDCREYPQNREQFLDTLKNHLLFTMCYTLNLEVPLGRYLNTQLNFTAAALRAVDVINGLNPACSTSNNPQCSSRVTHDCEVVTNTHTFTAYYGDYMDHLHALLEGTNS